MFNLTAKKIIKLARQTGCHNIVFGVNEPIVSLPTLQELAAEAKAVGLPIGCLTNGFMTEEAAVIIRECFAFINISLKSLSADFYRRHAGPGNIEPILRNYAEDREDKDYPFSGYFCCMCAETLGEGFQGRSIAVGTRSIITHLASGADNSIECFARGLYNYGTMWVVNKQENI